MDEISPRLQDTPRKKGPGLGCFLGLIIPALVITPLWFFFLGPQIRHDNLIEKGVQVPGRLLSVDETGTYVNDAPELELVIEFQRKDGVLDTSTTDFVPSQRSLHYFQDGANITAAYDPEDPDEITVVNISSGPVNPGMPLQQFGNMVDSLKHVMDSLQRFADSLMKTVKP